MAREEGAETPRASGPREPVGSESGGSDLSSFESLGRGTGVLLLGTTLLFVFGFLSRVLIAREFPVADWGVFSLALALSGLLSVVGLLGLDQALARALAFEVRPEVRWAIVRYAVSVSTGVAVAISATLLLLSGPTAGLFHLRAETWVFQLFAIATGFNLLSLVLAAIFQGFEDARPNAIYNQIVNPALFVVFVAIAAGLRLGFVAVVAGYLAASALSFLLLAAHSVRRRQTHRPAGPVPPAPRGELWRLSASLWGVGTLAYATAFADTVILGVFRPAADVGAYAALMVLGRVLLVANGTLTYIYLPIASRLTRQRAFSTIRSTYLVGTRWVLLVVTPGFLLLLLLPRLSLTAVFGANYAAGAVPLQI
ncbi:MAG: oligosaccharide flippase family protein, partial [Thermoplasmata archaeon]|nr:oligosaccharide flippase family protein [Thermoplasmata archaeon]